MLTIRELEIRQRLKDDFPHYAEKALRIRTKSGGIVPFLLNSAQSFINNAFNEQKSETGRVRAILLKGRQQGCSTLVQGRFFWLVTHNKGMRAYILTHESDATNNLFEMAQRFHAHVPQLIRPKVGTANAKELNFPALDSGYKVGTAGTKGTGRSSTIQFFHGSEVAYWPNASDHAKGVLQTVPDEAGTEIVLESTANGVGNYYHQQWQMAERGEGEYRAIFVPWFWQSEYAQDPSTPLELDEEELELRDMYSLTEAQLYWRRKKIVQLSVSGVNGAISFRQEYPCTPMEAFSTDENDTYITVELATKARQHKDGLEKIGPLLIGVDPARFGDDRTAIIRRRGRVAYGLQFFRKKDTMEVAGIVYRIIREEKPDRVFVDSNNVGAGVVDRLHEMGFKDIVVGINGGEGALESDKYANRRAEMWANTKLWLEDFPCQIPDSDSLVSDLCSPKYKLDSKSRLLIEKKSDMKGRGLQSPDGAEALGLTLAEPVAVRRPRIAIRNVVADSIAGY